MSLAYDAHDGYVLALAPVLNNSPANWGCSAYSFSAGNWSNLSAPPTNLSCAGLEVTYDPDLGAVVTFGGEEYPSGAQSGGLPFLADTWTYAAGNWTNRTATTTGAPPGTLAAGFVYDSADHYAVMYGGFGSGGNSTLTWTYSLGNWTDRTTSAGAPPPNRGSMAYDAKDGYVLYFGGTDIAGGGASWEPSVTWKYSAGAWSNITGAVGSSPPGRSGGAMAFDNSSGATILFGGIYYIGPNWYFRNDTWAFSRGSWTNLTPQQAPGARENALLVPDPGDGGLLLFGGFADGAGDYSDTWVFAQGSWQPAGPALLVPRSAVTVGSLLTIEVEGVLATAAATYAYSGLPTGCNGANAPILRCRPVQNGTFLVVAEVRSGALGSANASAVVVVGTGIGPHHPTPGTPATSAWLGDPALLAYIGIATVSLLALGFGERRRARLQREARAHLQDLRDHGPELIGEMEPSGSEVSADSRPPSGEGRT